MKSNSFLINEMDEMISENDYQSFNDISSPDMETLITILIQDNTDWLDSEEVHELSVKYILNDTIENASELAESIRRAAYEYYRDSLLNIFNDRLNQRICSKMHSKGLRQIKDPINGETTWVK